MSEVTIDIKNKSYGITYKRTEEENGSTNIYVSIDNVELQKIVGLEFNIVLRIKENIIGFKNATEEQRATREFDSIVKAILKAENINF